MKLEGYDFFNKILKKPKYIVAPMVEHSEHAWRILTRRYGADLCFTPMFNAKLFADPRSELYRKEQWNTNEKDRPLIVQLCGNDPEYMLKAGKLVEDKCDAVDVNLGCPQHIARRGHYGSYLMEEWDLIESIVKTLHKNLKVPVTCKIRVYPDMEKTLRYAKMLENAGCQMLTVHARFREQKGHNTGLANWEYIKKIKETVKIPVVANGNILYHEDIQRCLDETGADAVMSGEGVLYNPGIFRPGYLPVWHYAEEYLNICKELPESSTLGSIRAHLFKLFKPCLHLHIDLRARLAKADVLDEFFSIVNEFKERLIKTAEENPIDDPEFNKKDEKGHRIIPHWLAQPYIREKLVHDKRKMEKQQKENEIQKEDENQNLTHTIDNKNSIDNANNNNNNNDKTEDYKDNNNTDEQVAKKRKITDNNTNDINHLNEKIEEKKETSKKEDIKKNKYKNKVKQTRTEPRIRCLKCNNISSNHCLHKYCKLCCREVMDSDLKEYFTSKSEEIKKNILSKLCPIHIPHSLKDKV